MVEVADEKKQSAAVDKWALKEMTSSGKPWSEQNTTERIQTVLMTSAKIILVVLLLYMFIISLSLMGGAFKVVGGKTSGRAFRSSEIFANPVAGLSLGILVTVLVQSSSTSTSIIITMTAADLLSLKNAIPMIMGANIGTAVTASIVSVASIGDKDQYRRAFSGAIVHYCFNILTVCVLMPVEVATSMLQHMSEGLVDAFGISDDQDKGSKTDFLKKITKPVSSRILQVDKKLVTAIAAETDPTELAKLEEKSIIVQSQSKDNHLFMDTPMTDGVAGAILIIVSLLFLSVCLMLLVKTLQSVFKGRAAIWIGKMLNLDFKTCPLLGDYVLMVFGMGLTILMQSSSVTTSTLTPLVGIGLIRVEKMFPFTIGANIGTTVTGILAALASSNIQVGMQVAMSHLLFNSIGTLMWFMVPTMRAVPIAMAKFLGNVASDVKAFPILLIVFAWVVAPGALLGLSFVGVGLVAVVGGLVGIFFCCVFVLIWVRSYLPHKLPAGLARNPAWLPVSLRANVTGESAAASDGEVKAESPVDTDKIGSGWWQAPLAWGNGWFILMMVVMAVPNCQWGNLKYPKFDKREHVGIGAWQACSQMYTSEASWAQQLPACTPAQLQNCGPIKDCTKLESSDIAGANENYEKSWTECRKTCSLASWSSYCLGMDCQGSNHKEQCENVTKAVHQDFQVSYSASGGQAWSAGDICRDVSDVCDNGATLGHAGNFGWSAFAFTALGQSMLIAYCALNKSRDMFKVLVSSLASFVVAWVLMLASWATFANALGSETSCTVMDASTLGAVVASGPFGDIIMGQGSYSYALMIWSWILLTVVVGIVGHRAYTDRKTKTGKDVTSGEAESTTQPDTRQQQIAQEIQLDSI